ncbi:MAG: chromosomal replication initiator protein DnaA [Chloroflexi bacterium]|nr:chromosomal replication initiator protein DnaA [Chloroflexota bacterium]
MNGNPQRIWAACLGQLQMEVPRASYDTWLKGTVGLALVEGRLTVGVPTTFATEWLERRMAPTIHRVVSAVVGAQTKAAFQVAPSTPAEEDPRPPQSVVDPRASFSGGSPSATLAPSAPEGGVNPRYSFSSFVVGDGNQLAYAAATAVAQRPGFQYNPLFIYSGVGLGKTHLLHAIAIEALAQNLHPMYVTSEQFTGDFIRAVKERSQDDFRAKYRSADLLLVDDIQFLEGREQTQVSFFHTFNELHNADKQIVIACDRSPGAVEFLEDRLRSRFQWGLVTDIQPPDVETRTAILQSKAERARVRINEEVASLIARMPLTSVRELEGCLNKVIALASFTGKAITADLVASALGGGPAALAGPTTRTPQQAIAAVARHYGIPFGELCRRSKDRRTTESQRVAMYILSAILHLRSEEAGQLLGSWNRRTVTNSVKSIATRLGADPALAGTIHAIVATM